MSATCLSLVLAAEILLPGPHARLAFNERGFLTSIRENTTGRELISEPVPFVRVLMDGRKSPDRATKLESRGDRLTFAWADGRGELVFRTRRFEGGWLFTAESFTVTNAASLFMGCFLPACRTYYGGSLNMISDETSGVAAIDCGLDLEMYCDESNGLGLEAVRERGFTGKTFGIVAGPRGTLAESIQALTVAAGVRPSPCGGGWALASEANRASYLFAVGLTPDNVDGWIGLAKLASIGILHQDYWYETRGEYKVKKSLFPNGFADMKRTTDRIRAAGLKAGMHMLTGCIHVHDGLVPKRMHELQEWCSYTLAEPFTADSKELVVNEPLDPRHDVVYTYSGNGNFLLVGDEIVQYSALRRERPYAFLGLTRAVRETKSAPSVPAGSHVGYLMQRYRAFYPREDSKLADDLADNIARVYNDGGFEHIYFDGAEGMGTKYKSDVMCRKIYDRLARPPIAEGGGFRHSWWWRSRKGAWDAGGWAAKRFVDTHIKAAKAYKMSDLVQPQMGWWCPRSETPHARGHFLDEMEYCAGKVAAIDASFAMQNIYPERVSDEARRQLELFGVYERFRLDRRFSERALALLGTERAEARLRRTKDGEWTLTPVEAIVRRSGGTDERRWTLDGGAKPRKAALRILALYGAGSAQGVTLAPAGTVPACIRHPGPQYANCGTNRVMRFRVKGNGSGDVIRLRVTTPREYSFAESDHYILVDFTGWREFTMPFREREVDGAWFYEPPRFGHGSTFMNVLAYDHISQLEFSIVKKGTGTGGEPVAFSPVEVVPEISVAVARPAVVLNGRRLVVPFELGSGEYAELESDGWTHFSGAGKMLGRVPGEGLPELKAGVNELAFDAPDSCRAELTLTALGEPFPALRPSEPARPLVAFGAEFDVKEFDWGRRYTCLRILEPGRTNVTFELHPKCNRYVGWRVNALSDDENAVALRAYSPSSPSSVSAKGLSVTVRPGESFGVVEGPRATFTERMKGMALDSGAPCSKGGGPWSLESDLCRRSYLHAVGPTAENIGSFIALCERAGFGTLHLREGWYDRFGHYEVNRKAFPGGKDQLKDVVGRIHAAGLKAGMHTLTACIDPNDAWLKTDEITNLIAWTTYTLASPLDAAAKELVVAEPPIDRHDTVFTYSGNGNAIRIGREIVQYTGIRREKPYAFTGLTRGAWGTPVSDHAAGERADYLQERYLAFYPKPDSPLLGKIADAIADVFNGCGFDQIYCDGAEGMMTPYGLTKARRAIAERLKGEEIVNEGAMCTKGNDGFASQTWWFHSRVGNLDVPHWAPKRFHDIHLSGGSLAERKANFLVPQFGWWCPKLWDFHSRTFYVDDMEYYIAKNVAHDLVASMIGRPELAADPMPYHASRMLTVFGWYERARLERAFTPEALELMKAPRQDCVLRQSAKDGDWYLVRVRSPGLRRVEARYGAAPYDSPRGRAILSAADVARLETKGAAKPGVEVRVRKGDDAAHGPSLVLSAANRGTASRGAWAVATKRFAAPDYFNGGVAPGPTNVAAAVWIKGDGSGALLNLQLENPREHGAAYQEHYVDLDFSGWRYFEFTFRDNDAERWADYEWPYKDWLGIFHRTVFRGRIGAINVYLNEIPAGGRAEVELSEVRIVPMVERVLPAGEQPFDLTSGEFAELEHGAWTKYDRNGEPLERKTTGEKANYALGKPIRAFTPEGAKRIRYEAVEPLIWDPAKGFDRLPPVIVRPGEQARIEVGVSGEGSAKVTIGGVTRTGGGDFGVFSGSVPIRVECPAGRRVRLDVCKRYGMSLR